MCLPKIAAALRHRTNNQIQLITQVKKKRKLHQLKMLRNLINQLSQQVKNREKQQLTEPFPNPHQEKILFRASLQEPRLKVKLMQDCEK